MCHGAPLCECTCFVALGCHTQTHCQHRTIKHCQSITGLQLKKTSKQAFHQSHNPCMQMDFHNPAAILSFKCSTLPSNLRFSRRRWNITAAMRAPVSHCLCAFPVTAKVFASKQNFPPKHICHLCKCLSHATWLPFSGECALRLYKGTAK